MNKRQKRQIWQKVHGLKVKNGLGRTVISRILNIPKTYDFSQKMVLCWYQRKISRLFGGIISLTNLNSGTEIGIISQTERQVS